MRSAIFGAPLSSAAATMSQYHLRSPVPVSQAESCLSHVQSACHYQSAVSLARERDDKQTYHFSQQQHEQIVSKHQCRLTDDSFAQRCLLHPEADHATEIVAVASFTNLQEMSMACTSLAEMSTTVYHLEANTGEMTRHCGCENGPHRPLLMGALSELNCVLHGSVSSTTFCLRLRSGLLLQLWMLKPNHLNSRASVAWDVSSTYRTSHAQASILHQLRHLYAMMYHAKRYVPGACTQQAPITILDSSS